jgi:hypothetical protein
MYRLDRNAFAINNVDSAAHQRAYWLSRPPEERLAAAWYLICCAWNLDMQEEHPLDRTFFSMRNRDDADEKQHIKS